MHTLTAHRCTARAAAGVAAVLALALALGALTACGPMPGPPPSASESPASSSPASSCRDALTPLVARMMAHPDDPTARDFPKPPECASTSDEDYRKLLIDLSLSAAGNN